MPTFAPLRKDELDIAQVVVLFAHTFGWTIEYTLSLTEEQIRVLCEGINQLHGSKDKSKLEEQLNKLKGERGYGR